MKTTSAAGPGWTTSTAPDSLTRTYRRAAHGDQGQEHEEEHGEEAGSEDAEGEAAGQEGQEVAAPLTRAAPTRDQAAAVAATARATTPVSLGHTRTGGRRLGERRAGGHGTAKPTRFRHGVPWLLPAL